MCVQTKLFRNIRYIDFTHAHDLLPPRIRSASNIPRWGHRLVHLNIPTTACVFTDVDNLEIVLRSSTPGNKLCWLPLSIWQSLIDEQPIQLDTRMFKDMVASDGYVNIRMLSDLLGTRPSSMQSSCRSFEVELRKVLHSGMVFKWADGDKYAHPAWAYFFLSQSNKSIAARAMLLLSQVSSLSAQEIIANIDPPPTRVERGVRTRLMQSTGGEHSVVLLAGSKSYKADIVTDSHLIEVKSAKNITSVAQAIGQCAWYGQFYPGKKLRVHIFGSDAEIKRCQDCPHVARVAETNGVEITCEII